MSLGYVEAITVAGLAMKGEGEGVERISAATVICHD